MGINADTILNEYRPLKIFVYANMVAKMERCKQRATAREQLSDRQLEQSIQEIDRRRTAPHDLLSSIPWGDKQSYRLCVDTSNVRIKVLFLCLQNMHINGLQ